MAKLTTTKEVTTLSAVALSGSAGGTLTVPDCSDYSEASVHVLFTVPSLPGPNYTIQWTVYEVNPNGGYPDGQAPNALTTSVTFGSGSPSTSLDSYAVISPCTGNTYEIEWNSGATDITSLSITAEVTLIGQ